MFIEDIVKDFYKVLLGKRVLLLVSFDVDALCACKILQHLLQCDHIPYSLVPVAGIQDVKIAFMEHSEQVKHVIFINCGGSINLVEELQPEDDVTFFVIDSHRPVNVYNIYNAGQVALLMRVNDEDDVPDLSDIYKEDSEGEEEEEGGDEDGDSVDEDPEGSPNPRAKRRRLDERAIEKRIAQREWEQKRDKVLFEYTQFSYYAESSAIAAFELAWKMSKDNNYLLWWACVGLTDLLVHHKIDQTKYVMQAGSLQGHVGRLNRRSDDDHQASVHTMKLSFDKELQLVLYRHWSLHQSFRHTSSTACKFRLWTLKGEKRLYEFLVELGLPLAQCKQRFTSMDLYLRNNTISWIEEKAEKYGLETLINGSFLAQYGFKHKFCASDFVFAASALLESEDKKNNATDNFLEALDCLSRSNIDALVKGITLAKSQLTAVSAQVQTFLDLNQVVSAGPFLYAVISESSLNRDFFLNPLCLTNLAYCLLQAHVAVSKNRKSRNLPLVLSASSASDTEEGSGKLLVVGIPPVSEESSKNFFGQAFIQASKAARTSINTNFFDTHIIEIRAEDNSKFFDALISLLI